MPEPGELRAQQEAFERAGAELHKLMPAGDSRIVYLESSTAPVADSKARAYNPGGKLELPDGRANPVRIDSWEFFRAIKDLRAACYIPGKGTWFGVKITVTPDGRATAEYNYDREPEWDVPVDPIAYVTDQEKFPRDEECQPDWLKQRLAEGRARLAEREKQ